jgi:pilus assembly protein CpaC
VTERERRPSHIRLYPKAIIMLMFILIVIMYTPLAHAEEKTPLQIGPAQGEEPLTFTVSIPFGVVVGCSRILYAEDVVRAAVANPNIADIVVVSKSEIIINGKAEGRTTMYVWDSSGRTGYDIRVYEDNQDLLSEIHDIIGLDSVVLRFAKSTLLLEGTCATDAEYERADKIANAYTDRVLNLITVLNPKTPPPPLTIDASQVVADMGIEGVHVRVVKGAIILEGLVKTPGDAERAEEFARLFAAQVLNFIDVETPAKEEAATAEPEPVAMTAPPQPVAEDADDRDTEDETRDTPTIDSDEELRDKIVRALRVPDIEVMVVDGTALLEGEVPDSHAKLRAEAVARLYAERVVSVLRIAEAEPEPLPAPVLVPETPVPAAPEVTLEDMVSDYIGLPTVNVRSIDGKLLLEGSVESQNDLERVQRIAELFSKDVVILLDVADPVQVLLQVQVVEINKGALKNLGITWGSMIDSAFTPGSFMFGEWTSPLRLNLEDAGPEDVWQLRLPIGNVISELWRLSPIRVVLDTLVSEDLAKVLAAPSLLTLSGEHADFLVGGEIPVYLGQVDGRIVFEWRPYGVKLDILPTVDTRGRIVLDIQPEVSSLDWNNALDVGLAVVPALKTRRASTHLIVEDGVTIAIGGLIHTTEAKIVKKLPILGDIPIIGGLFRSERFEHGESELIILITPRVVRIGETMFWNHMISPEAKEAVEIDVKTLGK